MSNRQPQPTKQIARRPVRAVKASARYQRFKVLYRISDLINSTIKTETLLRRILRETVSVMRADAGSIRLLTDDRKALDVMVAHGVDAASARQMRLAVGQGVTGWVAQTGKLLRVDDVSKSPRYVEWRRDVQSELAVPLIVEGEVIGVLNVESTRLAAFSESDEKLLAAIGGQAAKVIHTARLYDRIAEQNRRIEALFEVGQALIAPDPLSDVLQRITASVRQLLDIRQCSVMVINERRELVQSAVSGQQVRYAQHPGFSLSMVQAGDISVRRQPLEVFKVKKVRQRAGRRKPGGAAPASLLSVPIFFHERLIGFLNLYTPEQRQFSEDEMRLLHAFASLCGIAIENAQCYERVLSAEHSIRQADRLATLGILSAEIAHEVRNPISIMSMLLHSLMEDKAVAPSREKDIAIITEKLERIDRIVSKVLNFSKRREPKPEWLNLNAVLEDVLFLVGHLLQARQVQLRRHLESALPQILADRSDFDQIFLNMVMNAVEAMPLGGILFIRSVWTPVQAGPTGTGVISVSFRDTGVGISPEAVPHLFSPFYSTRPEGFGLGLFVSNKLLSQYGGEITVRSAEGKGATFTVKVPVEQPA
jgi:signal transduction histidine kinase